MMVIVGQIDSRTDQSNVSTMGPCFADACVQNRCLISRVGPDQQDTLGSIYVFDRGGTGIGRRLNQWNLTEQPTQPISESARDTLRDYFRDDVRQLGELLDRDLDHWLR